VVRTPQAEKLKTETLKFSDYDFDRFVAGADFSVSAFSFRREVPQRV